MARILWRDAQGHEGQLDFAQGEAKIGRANDCAIRTDDAMVSRNHARLYWEQGQCYVEDLGSANGIYYQEQRVTRHALRHGDAVRCGSLWLRYVDHSAAQQPAPAPVARPQGHQAPPPAPVPLAQPPGGSGPTPMAGGAESGEAQDEIRRLRRRIDQLQAELRVYRGGAKGVAMEDLENEVQQLGAERDQLKLRISDLERQIASEGGNVKIQQAGQVREKAAEVVQALNDLLSNMRINMTAAEGEFDQFSNNIPRASFELIREALRSSSNDVETARELLRELRRVAG
ncbi:MAG TPA: FHA domain-containing protein [Kofleriaceae bacterium]|nr:FHA domain-containing protein [Kofleriaceae bacterium]